MMHWCSFARALLKAEQIETQKPYFGPGLTLEMALCRYSAPAGLNFPTSDALEAFCADN